MTDRCKNCDAEIREGGILKGPNFRVTKEKLERLNRFAETPFVELCNSCGQNEAGAAMNRLYLEAEKNSDYITDHITDFPMMTVGQLQPGVRYKIKSMVTSNVAVGTGIFSEISQSFSDLVGATNTASGMAHKVNSGESAARRVLITKAIDLGANCIIGVDVDYGTTANNSATVNMQGTAIVAENLSDILDDSELVSAEKIADACFKAKEAHRWIATLMADWGRVP